MDLSMNGRAHARSYRDLLIALREVGVPSITHAEAFARPEGSEYLAIRHDVDHDLARALKMARIEREEGIRSTYYLLPPGDYASTQNYYGRIVGEQIYASAELAEGALELQSLGHEVGLHNDFLQLSTLLRRPVAELIREEIAYFASIGVAITGSASHGSGFARRNGFANYEIFAETKGNGVARSINLGEGAAFELFSIPMADVGLRYEAYWVPRQVYISDTGSEFSVDYNRTREASLSWIRDSIGSARRIAALIHADWWDEAPARRDLETVLAAPATPAQQSALAVPTDIRAAAPPVVADEQNPGRATLGDYGGFLATLLARVDVEFITYDDLAWGDDVDYVNSFPGEWDRWRKRMRGDEDMQKKVHVLIQHDTDSGPAETLAMAQLEANFGARSSIMTFARRPLRVGEPEIESYQIDWHGLRSLVRQGFVVGYHCNALHLACFDEASAPQAFTDDLLDLSHRGFKIDYFTAHGGRASPSGAQNSSVDYPSLTGSNVRWVNTRFGARFDGYFSDGGKGSKRSGVERFTDLREFVAGMRPGCRYRILVHAQYFEPIDMHAAMCLLPPWPARAAEAQMAVKPGAVPASDVASVSPAVSALAIADGAADPGRATLGDYGGFLATLLARGDVEFITYDDMQWEDDTDHVNSFPGEWDRWRKRVRGDKGMQDKVHVLIQHDTDSGPAETLAMARLEAAFGVRSSIMTFARRPLRVGEPAIEDYRIDWDGLQALVRQGFVVGYHCNALHLACFDEARAPQAFTDDVADLSRRGFRIDYFTAHGGPSSPTGAGNSAVDYPGLTGSRVRWVNTRFSPRFDGYFSDGGKGSNRSGVERFGDLREFVAGMRPGGRYRILIHAQYFEPFDLQAALCVLPPWPPRPVSARQAPAASAFKVAVRSDRPVSRRLYDAARERARRVFGGSRAWRLLSRIVHAPGRLRRLEAAVALRNREAEALKAQIETLREKNQALYRRTVEYADRIQKLNAAAAAAKQKAASADKGGSER